MATLYARDDPHYVHEMTIRNTIKCLGITHYAMGKLLGMRTQNYAQWMNGRHRPGSRSWRRIAELHILHHNGLPLIMVDHIDWKRNEIVYKKGVTRGDARGRDPLYKFGGGLPPPPDQDGTEVPHIPGEQQGQASPGDR